MTQHEINCAHEKLARDYSSGKLTFDEFKDEVKKLDAEVHDHIYKRGAAGEQVCWCGASK